MRVCIVTESFLPSVNGVTNSVLRILENLDPRHDQVLVIAPNTRGVPTSYYGHAVSTVPAIPSQNFLPVELPMGLPQKRLRYLIEGFAPDVIHLASPFALGGYAAKVAKKFNIPTVSVYQTDVGGFARQHGFAIAKNSLQKFIFKIHSQTDRTLAPSKTACLDLHLAGVLNTFLWQRGIDASLFNPTVRDRQLQSSWRNKDKRKTIVGYVGRLSAEKRVGDLVALSNRKDIALVIVGDGPNRSKLEKQMPGAIFTGFKSGQELAKVYASLDLFVHPGQNETFCQAVHEALASGVPAIVPKSGGSADLISHDKTGYVIDTANSQELLATVLNHFGRKDRKQMSLAARASVIERGWPKIIAELKQHYLAVIDSSSQTQREKVGAA